MSSNIIKWLSILLTIGISFFYVYFTILANSEFNSGRFLLHMDELITFDIVREFYSATTLTEFIYTIAEADMRYGSSLYFISALFGFVPFMFGGEQMLIFSIRMVLVAELLAAYFILCFTFIKTGYLRLITIAILLTLTSTSYYSTMPKPEPLQLLFLAIFLRKFLDKQIINGSVWFWLGLAFGTKISIFPILLVFIILFFIFASLNLHSISIILIRKNLLWFLSGWLICNPQIILYGLFGLRRYFINTFLNITHGVDDLSINSVTWLNLLLSDWLSFNIFAGTVISVFLLLPLLTEVWNSVRNQSKLQPHELTPLILSLLGLISLFSIIFHVNRTWQFYLHIALVLIIVGAMSGWDRKIKSSKVYVFIFIMCLPVLLGTIYFKGIEAADQYKTLAMRETALQHSEQLQALNEIETKIKSYDRATLKVAYDPSLYQMSSHRGVVFERFWDRLSNTQLIGNYDIIVGECTSFSHNDINVIDGVVRCPKITSYSFSDLVCSDEQQHGCYSAAYLGANKNILFLELRGQSAY